MTEKGVFVHEEWNRAFVAIGRMDQSSLKIDSFRKKLPKFSCQINNENIQFQALPIYSVTSFGAREVAAIIADNIDIDSNDFERGEVVVIFQEIIDGQNGNYKTTEVLKRNGNTFLWDPLFEKGHVFSNVTPERLIEKADDAYDNLILGQEITL